MTFTEFWSMTKIGEGHVIDPISRELWLRTIGEGATCKPSRDGYLVRVMGLDQCNRVAKTTNLKRASGGNDYQVKMVPHSYLNTRKGVFKDPGEQLADLSIEDIKENIEGAIKLHRYKSLYFVELAVHDLPTTIKIGADSFRLEPCKPRPKTCKNCLRYAHGATNCKAKKRCDQCGDSEHDSSECAVPVDELRCIHCHEADHLHGSKDCYYFKREFKILDLAEANRISRRDAILEINKIMPAIKPSGKTTLAESITKSLESDNSVLKSKLENAISETESLKKSLKKAHDLLQGAYQTIQNLKASATPLPAESRDAIPRDVASGNVTTRSTSSSLNSINKRDRTEEDSCSSQSSSPAKEKLKNKGKKHKKLDLNSQQPDGPPVSIHIDE